MQRVGSPALWPLLGLLCRLDLPAAQPPLPSCPHPARRYSAGVEGALGVSQPSFAVLGRGPLCFGGIPRALTPWGTCTCLTPQPDQSGIFHEIHQPRYEPEEDPVQKADRCLRCEDQRGDQVGAASGLPVLASVPLVPANLGPRPSPPAWAPGPPHQPGPPALPT